MLLFTYLKCFRVFYEGYIVRNSMFTRLIYNVWIFRRHARNYGEPLLNLIKTVRTTLLEETKQFPSFSRNILPKGVILHVWTRYPSRLVEKMMKKEIRLLRKLTEIILSNAIIVGFFGISKHSLKIESTAVKGMNFVIFLVSFKKCKARYRIIRSSQLNNTSHSFTLHPLQSNLFLFKYNIQVQACMVYFSRI